MTVKKTEWDYCHIKYQIRHKGEDLTQADMKRVWLVFQGIAMGQHQNYIAGESTEIPIAANVMGVSFSPQQHNPSHREIHQNLIHQLQADGWELTSEKGGDWWERRLRRPAESRKSTSGWRERLWRARP